MAVDLGSALDFIFAAAPHANREVQAIQARQAEADRQLRAEQAAQRRESREMRLSAQQEALNDIALATEEAEAYRGGIRRGDQVIGEIGDQMRSSVANAGTIVPPAEEIRRIVGGGAENQYVPLAGGRYLDTQAGQEAEDPNQIEYRGYKFADSDDFFDFLQRETVAMGRGGSGGGGGGVSESQQRLRANDARSRMLDEAEGVAANWAGGGGYTAPELVRDLQASFPELSYGEASRIATNAVDKGGQASRGPTLDQFEQDLEAELMVKAPEQIISDMQRAGVPAHLISQAEAYFNDKGIFLGGS